MRHCGVMVDDRYVERGERRHQPFRVERDDNQIRRVGSDRLDVGRESGEIGGRGFRRVVGELVDRHHLVSGSDGKQHLGGGGRERNDRRGRSGMVTGPVAVSMVTGKPGRCGRRRCDRGGGRGGRRTVVLVAGLSPQAARTATTTTRARKGILLKKTSSLSEDEGVGRFGNRTISPSSETLRVCRRGRRPGLPSVGRNRRFRDPEGITAAGQRPDSHRDFAAFSGPQSLREGRGEYREVEAGRLRRADPRRTHGPIHGPRRDRRPRATFGWRWSNSYDPSSAGFWRLRPAARPRPRSPAASSGARTTSSGSSAGPRFPASPGMSRRTGLRPVERGFFRCGIEGLSYEEIGARFRRDAEFARAGREHRPDARASSVCSPTPRLAGQSALAA